jgi:hypothetical protein
LHVRSASKSDEGEGIDLESEVVHRGQGFFFQHRSRFLSKLEDEVNAWLAADPGIKILQPVFPR